MRRRLGQAPQPQRWRHRRRRWLPLCRRELRPLADDPVSRQAAVVPRHPPASRISSPTTPGSACETTRMSSASNMQRPLPMPVLRAKCVPIDIHHQQGRLGGRSNEPGQENVESALLQPLAECTGAREPDRKEGLPIPSSQRARSRDPRCVAITECPHVPQAMLQTIARLARLLL